MEQIVLIIHVILAIALIGLILIQQGKGAEVGASFGSGASQTVFGSQGSGSFLTRITAILIGLFFITNLGLGYLTSRDIRANSIDEIIRKNEIKKEEAKGKESPNKNKPEEKQDSLKKSDIPE